MSTLTNLARVGAKAEAAYQRVKQARGDAFLHGIAGSPLEGDTLLLAELALTGKNPVMEAYRTGLEARETYGLE